MPSSEVKESISKNDYIIIESLASDGWVTLSVDTEEGEVVKLSISYGIEEEGQTPDTIPVTLINKFQGLRILEITDTPISRLSRDMFEGLTVEELLIIDCEVEVIEEATFDGLNLHYLNLTGNLIRSVQPGSFLGCSGITELCLAENQISDIAENTWKQLPALETLLISNNQLEKLTKSDLDGLNNVQYLDLSENWINQISPDAFKGMPLSYLNLSGNNLSELSDTVFESLSNLEELLLEDNEIIFLDQKMLEALPNLEILILSNNSFESFPNFGTKSKLKVLALDENVIEELSSDDLKNLEGLEQLDLSANNLQKLPDNFLSGLSNLIFFYASDNIIEEIPSDFFKDCKELIEIDLSNCEITHVDVEPLKHLTKLKKISIMDGNKLSIDNLKELTALEKLGVVVN